MKRELKLSDIGENIDRGDVVGVLVREGDVVSADDRAIEIETDKAVLEIPCALAGEVVKVHVVKGQTVEVGQTLLTIEVEESQMSQPSQKPDDESQSDKPAGRPSKPSPGIPAQPGSREPAVPPGDLGRDEYGHVRREPMSDELRAAVRTIETACSTPQATICDDADITELERMRKTIPPAYLGPTIKLTAMPFLVRSTALALRQHPLLNASLDEQIVYKQYVNIGMAFDTPRGTLRPVVRGADRASVLHLARELTLLAARARSAEFDAEELDGGTFTIANPGEIGGLYSTPLVNPPEVGVLATGRSRWTFSVFEGKIEGRLKMPLSLSFDRRLVAPSAAARFLNDVIDYLQSPGKLLMANG